VLVPLSVAQGAPKHWRDCPQGVGTNGDITMNSDSFFGDLQVRHLACGKAAHLLSRKVRQANMHGGVKGYRCTTHRVDSEHSRTTCRKRTHRFRYRAGP
jgi:hypothetical protein